MVIEFFIKGEKRVEVEKANIFDAYDHTVAKNVAEHLRKNIPVGYGLYMSWMEWLW